METIEEFYKNKFNELPDNLYHTIGQFNVFNIENRMQRNEELPLHIRRNFLK